MPSPCVHPMRYNGFDMKRVPALLACLLVSLASAATTLADDYRIMPIGDSITEGGRTFANYRYPLLKKLTAAGYGVTFVGSRKSDSPAGPLAHEGYGGKTAEYLATVVGKALADHPADIVLIHAGHNHFADQKPVAKIVAANEAIIQAARKANPKVIVLLAQVIPSGKLPKYSYIPELNEKLADLAKRLDKPEQPVVLVDQATAFDPAQHTIPDKVHPNERGAEKMAVKWFETLATVLRKN